MALSEEVNKLTATIASRNVDIANLTATISSKNTEIATLTAKMVQV